MNVHDEADQVSTDGRAGTQDNSSPHAIAEDKDLMVQLERARALQAEFRAFADSAPDFAFITLSLDKSVVGWSKGAELLLGYSQEEVLGQPGAIFFTPEDVERGAPDKETTTALREGRAEDERWHMRKDGTKFWGSGVLTPLRNTSGELRGYAKLMRDGTEQRTFREGLHLREERLRLLVENIRDCAVFDLDRNGAICVWNSGAEHIFGYTEAEVVGVEGAELFCDAGYSPVAFRQELDQALEVGRAEGESWLVRKDGNRFYARWITNAVHTLEGETTGFIKVLRDETVRRDAEDVERRRSRYAWELVEQQARVTSTALGRAHAELADIGRSLLKVQEEERRRIARDLHDHLAQRLALLEIGLEHLRQGFWANCGRRLRLCSSSLRHSAKTCGTSHIASIRPLSSISGW